MVEAAGVEPDGEVEDRSRGPDNAAETRLNEVKDGGGGGSRRARSNSLRYNSLNAWPDELDTPSCTTTLGSTKSRDLGDANSAPGFSSDIDECPRILRRDHQQRPGRARRCSPPLLPLLERAPVDITAYWPRSGDVGGCSTVTVPTQSMPRASGCAGATNPMPHWPRPFSAASHATLPACCTA